MADIAILQGRDADAESIQDPPKDPVGVANGGAGSTPEPKPVVSRDVADKANEKALKRLDELIETSDGELTRLRDRLRRGHATLKRFTVAMFMLGIFLLLYPLAAPALGMDLSNFRALTSAGLGSAQIVVLLLTRPFDRMDRIQGNQSQMTMILNNHQVEVELRLLGMNVEDRGSIADAAEKIRSAAAHNIRLIQEFYE